MTETDNRPPAPWWWRNLPIVLIVLLAAILRIAWLDQSPPGLPPDEASNAWNAWCLNAVGMDEHSVYWPIFYTRAFNDGRTAMLMYAMLPTLQLMGLNVWSIRLPTAIAGVVAVLLLYRLVLAICGDRRVALLAALLLAVDPTHVQHSRWGLEAALSPMLVLASLLLWWRVAIAPPGRKGRPILAAISAGVVAGVACYGYAAIRLYLPLTIVALLLLPPMRKRWTASKTAAILAFALVFAPLAYKHLTDPAINARGRATRTWAADDDALTIVTKVGLRYVEHFSPKYLFVTGSTEPLLAPPDGFGALPWLWLPLLISGGVWAWRHRDEPLARFAIATVLLYPAADVISAAGNANVLRTFCGSWSLDLLAAMGLIPLLAYPRWQMAAAGACVANAALHVYALLWVYPNDDFVQLRRGNDIEAAAKFIRPIKDNYDCVVFTSSEAIYCYPQVLIDLGVTPSDYFTTTYIRATATDTTSGVEPDVLAVSGNLIFDQPTDQTRAYIAGVVEKGAHHKAIWAVRPSEVRKTDKILNTIHLTHGYASLVVVERGP